MSGRAGSRRPARRGLAHESGSGCLTDRGHGEDGLRGALAPVALPRLVAAREGRGSAASPGPATAPHKRAVSMPYGPRAITCAMRRAGNSWDNSARKTEGTARKLSASRCRPRRHVRPYRTPLQPAPAARATGRHQPRGARTPCRPSRARWTQNRKRVNNRALSTGLTRSVGRGSGQAGARRNGRIANKTVKSAVNSAAAP